MKPIVLVTGTIRHAHELVERLRDKYDVRDGTHYTRESLKRAWDESHGGELSQTRGIMYTMKDCPTGPMDQDMISSLPASVEVIANCGAGVDQIDLEAVRRRGPIQVSNTPGVVDDATADVGLYLLLTVLRPFQQAAQRASGGQWKTGLKMGHDPAGKTLGVLGLGGTGQALAKRAKACGMKIQYTQRHRASREAERALDAVYRSREELLASSDVLCICIPLNASTANMVDRSFLAGCKKGIYVVNTARGGIVETSAMVEAIKSGQVAAYGTDVYPNEPSIPKEFLDDEIRDRLSLLPHVGTETLESQQAMEELALKNIESALETGHVLNPVN